MLTFSLINAIIWRYRENMKGLQANYDNRKAKSVFARFGTEN